MAAGPHADEREMMSDLTVEVYRVFDPDEPLPPDKPDLYVDLDDVRGQGAVVKRLANAIRRSAGATCQLLAGHRGSGKTTELLRLQRELETGSKKKYFTVFCEADQDVDRNDVDFPDVLAAIVRQMAMQLRKRAEIKLKPGYFQDRWDRLKHLFGSEVSFDEIALEAGMLKVTAAIKSSPEARLEIRKLLEPDTGNWIDAANDVISVAALELSKKGYHGLVIIVDDLDKMVVRQHEQAGCSTAENLFVHRQAQLSAFACHMVYTLPLPLVYSSQAAVLCNLYGRTIPVVPMTKIATRPPENEPFDPGIEKFRQMIQTRLDSIRADSKKVFESDAVRDKLIRLSGGQPRELMILIREAFAKGDLPITSDGVNFAARDLRRSYARQLTAQLWPILDEVRRSGRIERTADNDGLVRELLDSRAVLAYVNDEAEEWYNLNPIIADLSKPTAR